MKIGREVLSQECSAHSGIYVQKPIYSCALYRTILKTGILTGSETTDPKNS